MITNKYIPNMRIFQQDLIGSQSNNKTEKKGEASFSDVLKNQLDKVNDKQMASENSIEGYIKGDVDIHQVMVASEEAKLSLDLAIQIRNKLINVYEEFNKMQV